MDQRPPPVELTPQQYQSFEEWLLRQVREAVQQTVLPRYRPNSQWVVTIENGRVAVKLRREDFTLTA